MIVATLNITGVHASVHSRKPITSGTVGATVNIQFDSTWSKYNKTYVWRGSGKIIDDLNATGVIPHEVVSSYGDHLMLGIYGYQGNLVQPSLWIDLGEILPGADPSGDESADPTLPAWAQIPQLIELELEKAKESGDFKGDKGDKGDPGEVKFLVVTELPETDTENAIYLVPVAESAEGNLFDEYIFVDGAWEKIGSTSVAVNLDEYVKNTDLASNTKAGVVRIMSDYGVMLISPTMGVIGVNSATEADIDAKSNSYKPISPLRLDYAIKKGLADNKETWTEEEKQAARELIGSASNDWATTDAVGLVRVGEGLFISSTTGKLNVNAAEQRHIDAKNSNGRVITPGNLDYAVKAALTANTKNLTDEEKAAVCSWVGAVQSMGAGSGWRVYGVYADGTPFPMPVVNAATTATIPWRGVNGTVIVGEPTANSHATTKGYVDGKFLEKVTTEGTWYDRVYAVDMTGTEQKMFDVSNSYVANSIAQRTQSGALAVNTPTTNYHATNKEYVDGLIAELVTRIEALESR